MVTINNIINISSLEEAKKLLIKQLKESQEREIEFRKIRNIEKNIYLKNFSKASDDIMKWKNKFNIVKYENNKLRKKNGE